MVETKHVPSPALLHRLADYLEMLEAALEDGDTTEALVLVQQMQKQMHPPMRKEG